MNTQLISTAPMVMASIVDCIIAWLNPVSGRMSPAHECRHGRGSGQGGTTTSPTPAMPTAVDLPTPDAREMQRYAQHCPVQGKHELAATAEILAGIAWLFDEVPSAKSKCRSLALVEDSLRLRPEGGLMLIPQPALLRAMGQLEGFSAQRNDQAWRSSLDRLARALAAAALLQARIRREATPAQGDEHAAKLADTVLPRFVYPLQGIS